MRFFTDFFENSDSEKPSQVAWRNLTDLGQLEELIALSHEKPILLFKHSSRCSISRFALKNFENDFDFSETQLQPYFLDVIESRSVSNACAQRFEVVHQSPQILLIKAGTCSYHESHEGIAVSALKRFM